MKVIEKHCYIGKKKASMAQYLEHSCMDKAKVWATEVEIYSAATLLGIPIYIFGPYNRKHHWLKYDSEEPYDEKLNDHAGLYLRNFRSHFEPVTSM